MPRNDRLRDSGLLALATMLLFAVRPLEAGDVEAALSLAAPDADIVIIAPDLKQTSDECTQLLERMERAELLVGSRPIDQLKSLLGFGAGVDDHGPVVALLYTSDQPAAAQPFDALLLVPVTDDDQFLQSSFEEAVAGEAGAYRTHGGRIVNTRAIGSHVVLGESAQRVQAYEPAGGVAQLTSQSLGERGNAIMNSADIVVLDRSGALARLLHDHGGTLHADEAIDAAPARQLHEFADHLEACGQGMEAGIIAIDIDPLALIVRSFAAFEPEHEAGRLTIDGQRSIDALSALPGKPYYLAMSIDKSGLGGEAIMRMIGHSLGITEIPEWLVAASGLQFAVYPSPAGLQGGILNDAVLIMRTTQPAQARDFFKQQILALRDRDDGITRQITWEDSKLIKPGLTADAFEVFVVDQPPDMQHVQMVQTMIFGSRGWRGFVHSGADALVMTFSQRPAVLETALAAAAGQGQTIDDLPIIRAMQPYLAPQCDAQVFINIGEILGLVKQVSGALGGFAPVELPEIDGTVEPLAWGAAVQDHTIETSLIAPASVLRILFDLGTQHLTSPDEPAAPINQVQEHF